MIINVWWKEKLIIINLFFTSAYSFKVPSLNVKSSFPTTCSGFCYFCFNLHDFYHVILTDLKISVTIILLFGILFTKFYATHSHSDVFYSKVKMFSVFNFYFDKLSFTSLDKLWILWCLSVQCLKMVQSTCTSSYADNF